ncbi:MAG TPA: histidine kinase dimerization/phospho-acceptor domain-containing protein, partial [bacterium]
MAEMSEEPFFQPEVQQAYDEYDRQVRINQIRIWAVLCSILLPAGITLDYFVYPEKVLPFLKLRLFCSLLSLLIWALLRVSWGQKHYRLLGLVLPLLPTFFIVCMIYSTEGVTSPYYAGLNLVLLAVGVLFSWTYLENLLVGVLVMVMYAVGCLLHGSFQLGGIFFNNVYFLVLTDVIVITSSYFLEKLRLREFAARFELDRNKRMLEESNRKLVEMDQVKSRFFANISHELRTPLTLLIAPLDALQAQAHLFDEAQREILKTMQGNAMRLLKLINDLLDLVKLESGKMEVRKEPLEIGDFMRGLIQAVQGVAKDKRVQLSSIVEESLNVILADRDKLEKIILNLLFNSIKFTSAGGKVEILAQAEGEFLALKVKDTGMGISEQNLPHIFDRFWQ